MRLSVMSSFHFCRWVGRQQHRPQHTWSGPPNHKGFCKRLPQVESSGIWIACDHYHCSPGLARPARPIIDDLQPREEEGGVLFVSKKFAGQATPFKAALAAAACAGAQQPSLRLWLALHLYY